jgi:hypothetical protein
MVTTVLNDYQLELDIDVNGCAEAVYRDYRGSGCGPFHMKSLTQYYHCNCRDLNCTPPEIILRV